MIFHPKDLTIDLVIYTISGQFNNPVEVRKSLFKIVLKKKKLKFSNYITIFENDTE